jgi:3-oxoacyl-[acyl-carrier protein] reductase
MRRIALVTGGGSGLGLATAKVFASAGMIVAVADLSVHSAIGAAAALHGEGHRGVGVDVADEAEVARMFDAVERDAGPVAVLAHFAGVAGHNDAGVRPPIVDETVANWDRTLAINLRGTFVCIREMLRRRRVTPVAHGRIVTISSLAAKVAVPGGSAAYAASKGGVLSLTRLAAREAAPLGITVNSIVPGAIDTPMLRTVMPRERDTEYSKAVPMGRVGLPDDVAAAALFLASEEASYITGSAVDVNGGLFMQ